MTIEEMWQKEEWLQVSLPILTLTNWDQKVPSEASNQIPLTLEPPGRREGMLKTVGEGHWEQGKY